MCQALLRARHGAPLEAWGSGPDFGRDAYAALPLRYPDPAQQSPGPFIFQVKYVANASGRGSRPGGPLLAAVRAELARIARRREAGQWTDPRVYTLLTNAPVTARLREQLTGLIGPALPGSVIIVHGAADIAASLDAAPEIRLSYPQILGLRDLRALLVSAAAADVVNRSAASFGMLPTLARVFVPTGAYGRALRVLRKTGFAVLTGPPEMGKTAMAWMIALARLTSGWDVYDCRGPAEIFRAYDPQRPQVFVADDAFGSTEYRADAASEWAAQLDRVIGICGRSHWLIWASRPGPLRIGLERLHLQGPAASFPGAMQVAVDAARLTTAEKAQMLYRHAKAAELPAAALGLLRADAEAIVTSPHFTPLRVRRLVCEQLPGIMAARPGQRPGRLRAVLAQELRAPSSAMRTSFNVLPEETKALLIAMLNCSGTLMPLGELARLQELLLARVPAQSARKTAGQIDGHFIRLTGERAA